MFQALKKKLKDQRGLTLIELLAVIVILGIIAAIAVPSILGLIGNSKKDAHIANAQQLINATKMVIAAEASYQTGEDTIFLSELESKGYLDRVDSPEDSYSRETTGTNKSFVKIDEGKIVQVQLASSSKIILTEGAGFNGSEITTKDVDRESLK